MSIFPGVFVSHGAPSLPKEEDSARDFLLGLGRDLGKPKATLVISAHWETRVPTLTAHHQPETIHDFYGFPDELYQFRYPAPGAPALAHRSVELLRKAGYEAKTNEKRGLDHGAWVPLLLMYPDADIPTFQLSLQTKLGPRHQFAVGRALAPLREEGVLIIGSGGMVHNLGEWRADRSQTPDWAQNFDDWIAEVLEEDRIHDLLDYRQKAPNPERAHPTDEHFLPLYTALAAAGENPKAKPLYRGFMHGNLSMAAYRFD